MHQPTEDQPEGSSKRGPDVDLSAKLNQLLAPKFPKPGTAEDLELGQALHAMAEAERVPSEPGYCTDRLCRESGERHLHEPHR